MTLGPRASNTSLTRQRRRMACFLRWRVRLALLGAVVIYPASVQTSDDEPPRRPAHLLVVCIGGADSDPTVEQIAGTAPRGHGNSGLYQLCGDLRRERVIAEYFNWNGTRAGQFAIPPPPLARGIALFVREHFQRHPYDALVIVGNSWGGQTALEVARLLLQDAPLAIQGMIFLDGGSLLRARKPVGVPLNVNRTVNYFTRNGFVWGRLPAHSSLLNIDLGDKVNGYLRNGGPAYDAPFDTRAHVAAEWDDRVHADIMRRLLELVPRE